ncbi:MAG: hypothetical protein AABX02_01265, partial [archaeon]
MASRKPSKLPLIFGRTRRVQELEREVGVSSGRFKGFFQTRERMEILRNIFHLQASVKDLRTLMNRAVSLNRFSERPVFLSSRMPYSTIQDAVIWACSRGFSEVSKIDETFSFFHSPSGSSPLPVGSVRIKFNPGTGHLQIGVNFKDLSISSGKRWVNASTHYAPDFENWKHVTGIDPQSKKKVDAYTYDIEFSPRQL